MQGHKQFPARVVLRFRLSERVPKHNLYRRLGELLDWDFLYQQTQAPYSHTGQPSLDPVVFFQLMLVRLLLLERSGTGRLRCFDLARYTEVDFSLAGGEDWPAGPKAYCLNADQTRLAVLRGSWVELFEVASRQLVRRFRLQHCVKSAKLHLVGEALGVRTDAGCFSLYQL